MHVLHRLSQLRNALEGAGADAWFSVSPPDNQYLSGFITDFGEVSAAVIVTSRDAFFLTDSRYTEQAQGEVHGYTIEQFKGDLLERAGERLASLDLRRVAFDPASITVDELRRLQSKFSGDMLQHKRLVKDLRQRKSPEEIGAVRDASQLAEGVLRDLLPNLKPGIEERRLAAQFEFEFKSRGAHGPSFSTIALFGARSSLPHGVPADRTLNPADIVLLDFGCRRNGYCSDLTRTYAFDTIPDSWFGDIYATVLEAQRAALNAVRPGVACRDVDKAARDIIVERGYGDYFGHGVGHGVGIEIHEAPRVNPHSDAVLEQGMIITIEPGIYIPGKGGVRIEDLVAVTDSGYDRISTTSTDLRVLR